MKGFVKLAIPATLIAALGVQAFAAPSPTGGTIDRNQVTVQTEALADNAQTESSEAARVVLNDIKLEDYPEEVQDFITRVENAESEATVIEVFGEDYDFTEFKVFDTESLNMEDMTEEEIQELLSQLRFLTEIVSVSFENVEPTEENPVEVTFTVNNMTDKMKVYVMAYCEEHGWELLETTRISDNQLSAKFHAKASLVSFVYLETEEIQLPEEGVGTSPATTMIAETEYQSEMEIQTETAAE